MTVKGVYAAMMTPFADNGEPDFKVIEELTDFYIEKGVSGIFPVSNVGEQIHLSGEEKKRFVETVVKRAKGRVPVLPGVSHSSPRRARDLARMCREAGADGVVCSAPYYFGYPAEVVEESLQFIAREGGIPLVLYNIPLYANPISMESFRKLMANPTICAVKDSSGSVANLLQLLQLAKEVRPDFEVLVGWEEMLYSALDLGASGCMTASAGIFPEIMRDLYDSSLRGDSTRAVRLQKLIAKGTEAMKGVYFPYGYKLGMEARGFSMGEPQVLWRKAEHGEECQKIKDAIGQILREYDKMNRE